MTPARTLMLIAMVVYAACLPFDAICIDGNCSSWPAWSLAAFGILGVLLSDPGIAWFANPILAFTWLSIFLNWRWLAIAAGLGATALALSFLGHQTIIANEGGLVQKITGVRLGYWLWVASMGLTVVSALLLRPEQARQ
jgi:hypothetical protein